MSLSIAGCGVVAPAGVGLDRFAAAAFGAALAPRPLAELAPGRDVPAGSAYVVEDLDVARMTGRRKGIRVLDRTSALAVVASHLALLDASHSEVAGDRVGVVLGTGCGSEQSLYQFIQDTYTAEQPHQVSPEMFARTVMNYAAGQIGIWFGLKALNTTISAGRMAGLLTLRYAARMLRSGHADRVLFGSVQEFSPEAAWIAHHMAAARGVQMVPLGEGAAMFVLDRNPPGQEQRLELAACEVATTWATDPASLAACLTGCILKAMRKSGARIDEIWAVASRSADAPTPRDAEGSALGAVLGDHRPAHLYSAQAVVGDTYSASGSLQLGMLLALFGKHRSPARACGLVTSISHQGMAGCACCGWSSHERRHRGHRHDLERRPIGRRVLRGHVRRQAVRPRAESVRSRSTSDLAGVRDRRPRRRAR